MKFGAKTALDRLDWQVPEGHIAAIMGANGAGKTTTIHLAVGLIAPTAGSIRTLGLDPDHDRAALQSSVGVALQSGGLYPTAKPRAFLQHIARLYSNPADVDGTLEQLGIDPADKTPIKRLSGGEQKRLACAAALIGRPSLAFLDEPTAGVDPVGKREIWSLLEYHRANGMTIVLSSHDASEVERLADSVIVLRNGSKVLDCPLAHILNPVGAITIHGPAHLDTQTLAMALPTGLGVFEVAPGLYRILGADSPAIASTAAAWAAQHGVSQHNVQSDRGGLEDLVMIAIRGAEL
jgi:ABC-2 type transport system ATP-binding protein